MAQEQQTIAAKIIDYLRSNSAFCDSPGVVASTAELSKTFGNSKSHVCDELKRLLDAGILLLKGQTRQTIFVGRPSKIVVLAKGYETGDDWKKILADKAPNKNYRRNKSSDQKTPSPRQKKSNPSSVLEFMREMVALTEELKQVHQENIGHKEQLSATFKENSALKQRISELESELALVEQTNREQQLELNTVTAQVRENMGQLQGFRVRNHQLRRQLSGFEG